MGQSNLTSNLGHYRHAARYPDGRSGFEPHHATHCFSSHQRAVPGLRELATSGSIGFTPVPPVTLFAVAYARNVGPSQVQIQFQVPGAVSVFYRQFGCQCHVLVR